MATNDPQDIRDSAPAERRYTLRLADFIDDINHLFEIYRANHSPTAILTAWLAIRDYSVDERRFIIQLLDNKLAVQIGQDWMEEFREVAKTPEFSETERNEVIQNMVIKRNKGINIDSNNLNEYSRATQAIYWLAIDVSQSLERDVPKVKLAPLDFKYFAGTVGQETTKLRKSGPLIIASLIKRVIGKRETNWRHFFTCYASVQHFERTFK